MRNLNPLMVCVAVIITFSAGRVFAAGAGGYRVEVPDAGAVGQGSAFAGEADTAAAVYYNPAGMTQITVQTVSVGLSLIEPHTTYKGPESADAVQMKRGDYAVPNFFYVTRLGTKDLALGIGTTTAWGLTTEWAPDSFARYVSTKTEMLNHDYYISTAYKLSEQWSVAVGLNIDQSQVDMEKKKDQSAVAGADANVKLAGDDTAVGFLTAAMFKLNDRHQFGLMYRSAIHHQYTGKVYIDGLDPTIQFLKNFPGPSYETDVTLKNVLPQSILFGYSYKPDTKWTFNSDLEWTDWSQLKQLAPTYTSETDPTRLSVLQDGYPVNKDWHSSLALSLGAQYAMSDRLRLRCGSYVHQSPVSKATRDTSIPDSDSLGVTLGSGYDLTKNLTVDLAWSGIIYKTSSVNNDVGNGVLSTGGNAPIDGKYSQWTNLLYATVTYRF